MLGLGNAQCRRAFALIEAFEGSEITTAEFADEIRGLSSEAVEVAGTILDLRNIFSTGNHQREWLAGQLCHELANTARHLS